MTDIFILFVLFQVKHFLCDFPLQNAYMLCKFNKDGWAEPQLSYCSVHAVFTFTIVLLFATVEVALALALLDLASHFIIDRYKVLYSARNNLTPNDAKFWHAIGMDQMVHHLTHYGFIAVVVTI